MSRHHQFNIPGKTFLMGEYLALFGGPTLVASTEPYFRFAVSDQKSSGISFHPKSPAGQWVDASAEVLSTSSFEFLDPYDGEGGFGASTAQFIGCYLASLGDQRPSDVEIRQPEFILKAWQDYRALFSKESLKPSGADLVAQIAGGLSIFKPESNEIHSGSWLFSDLDVLFLKTKSKVPTHEHLKEVDPARLPLNDLKSIAEQTVTNYLSRDPVLFLEGIKSYSEVLDNAGFLLPESKTLISLLSKEPGVQLSRGCGALGADVIAIFVDRSQSSRLSQDLAKHGRVISLIDSESKGITTREVR